MIHRVEAPEPAGEWAVQFVNDLNDTAVVRVIAADHADAIQGCRRIVERDHPGQQWRPFAAGRVTGRISVT